MKLLILILSVLCTHQCLAAKQLSILDVLQSFVVDCFQQQKDTFDVAYTGDNIDQVLNAQAGRDFFLKSQNGLKINATVLAAALSECIKSKTQNEQIQNTVNENQLSRGLNFVLEDREISLQDIDDLIYSRGVYVRGRRSIVVPRNVVTDVIYTLLIEPFKTTVSGVIDQINGIILDYYVDTSNITDSFQLIVVNVVNSAVQSTVGVLTFVQSKVNSLFTTTNSTTSNDTEKMVRFTSLQTRETIVDTIISSVVTPLKTVVNNVLDSLIAIVNSFIVADSDNIIQNVINSLTNNVVSAVVTSIGNFQTVLNTFLDSLIATNSTTT